MNDLVPPEGGFSLTSSSSQVHCHSMVKTVAMEMAGELMEVFMGRYPQAWAQFKSLTKGMRPAQREATFVKETWPQLIEPARSALAKALRSPSLSEAQKEEIVEALVKDLALRNGRAAGAGFRLGVG